MDMGSCWRCLRLFSLQDTELVPVASQLLNSGGLHTPELKWQGTNMALFLVSYKCNYF